VTSVRLAPRHRASDRTGPVGMPSHISDHRRSSQGMAFIPVLFLHAGYRPGSS
jgi:hypothetical protein